MMLFYPDASRVVQRLDGAELRMMTDLPPWLLALTGYATVATQHREPPAR
jgi:hypothetical protein